jgi:hypothetical protein
MKNLPGGVSTGEISTRFHLTMARCGWLRASHRGNGEL